MSLNAVYEDQNEIPEAYRPLFSEKNGKFELTGITGVRTQADIDRLSASLNEERNQHKATKEKYRPWGDLDYNDVMSKLDRMAELEELSKGKVDEAKIEELVEKRAGAKIQSRTAPLERQLASLTKERDEALEKMTQLQQREVTRTVHDEIRKAMGTLKVIAEAQDDVLLYDRLFELTEDGKVITRDGVGVAPGLSPQMWLQDMQGKRPHWWPASQGGGARGSGSAGGFQNNPWSHDNWNMTAQGEVVKTQGMDKAEAMAKSAGTKVGGSRPMK